MLEAGCLIENPASSIQNPASRIMLARGERLNTASFSVTFSNGRVLRHPLMQVRVLRRPVLPSKETISTRVAFVVPKKLGKAVRRNRLRRCVREQYRLHFLRAELGPALRGCDLIFVVAPPALIADSAHLSEALSQLLRRAARASVETQRQHDNKSA